MCGEFVGVRCWSVVGVVVAESVAEGDAEYGKFNNSFFLNN